MTDPHSDGKAARFVSPRASTRLLAPRSNALPFRARRARTDIPYSHDRRLTYLYVSRNLPARRNGGTRAGLIAARSCSTSTSQNRYPPDILRIRSLVANEGLPPPLPPPPLCPLARSSIRDPEPRSRAARIDSSISLLSLPPTTSSLFAGARCRMGIRLLARPRPTRPSSDAAVGAAARRKLNKKPS